MAGFNLANITSIHGKRIGLNSTGALILDHNGTKVAAVTKSSADVVQGSSVMEFNSYGDAGTHFPQRAESVINDIGSTISHGFTSLTSGASSDVAVSGWEIKAPYLGAECEIYIQGSASLLQFGGTSTAMTFASSDETSDAGSTLLVTGVDLRGCSIRLRGVSSLQWGIMSIGGNRSSARTLANGVSGSTLVTIG